MKDTKNKIVKFMKGDAVKEHLLGIDSVEKLQMLTKLNVNGSVQTFGYEFSSKSMINTISFQKDDIGTDLVLEYRKENLVPYREYIYMKGIQSVTSKINDEQPDKLVDIDIISETELVITLYIDYTRTTMKNALK